MRKIFTAILAMALMAAMGTARADWNYIKLSDYYLHPNQAVSVFGDGFAAGESVDVSVAGQHQTVTADGSGKFSTGGFTIPFSVIGRTIDVTASGNMGHTSSAQLVIGTYYPHVEPSSYYLVPGGSVQFFGKNFGPNERVAITGPDTAITVTADGSGGFSSASVPVPYGAGSKLYRFTGQTSGTSDTVTIHVSGTDPVVVLNNYYGNSGSAVEVRGRFFGKNETVSLNMDGSSLGTVTADNEGSFTTSITVPNFPSLSVRDLTAAGNLTGKAAAPAKYTLAWNNAVQGVSGSSRQNTGVSISVASVDRPTGTVATSTAFTVTPRLQASGGTAQNVTVTVKLADPGNQVAIQQTYAGQTLQEGMVTGFELQATGGLPANMYTISTTVQNADVSTLASFPNLGAIEVK